MLDNIIENKVKVFISSKCDNNRYTIMRRGLKELLLSTGLVEVYIFEDSASSSLCVEESYLKELDSSDLCIFIIDNSEEITEGILKEYTRAKTLAKRSMYLFCDEISKDKNKIQLEIEKQGLQKYKVIHEFSEIIHEAYRAIMQDITNIYKYKNKTSEQIKIQQVNEDSEIAMYKVKKIDSKGLQLTNKELLKGILNVEKIDEKELNEYDVLCAEFLKVVLRKQKINNDKFELLKNKILEMYSGNLKDLIGIRLEAVKLYYNGNVKECIQKLKNIIDKENDRVPKWILNDIAIDLRNLENIQDEVNNQIRFENDGQKYLNNCEESLYYPLIDRVDENRKKEILKRLINYQLESPYSTSIENIEYISNFISLCFYIALTNGSITHLRLTLDRIKETLLALNMRYDDHDMYVQTIKFLILTQDDKKIGKILRTYKNNIDVINCDDIDNIYNDIENTEIEYYKVISECILLQYFNLYFSDNQYNELFEKVCSNIRIWMDNDNRIINYGLHFFDVLKSNIQRGNNQIILTIALKVFDNQLKRFYDNALEVIQRLDYSNISKEEQEKLMKHLKKIIKEKDVKNSCNQLENAIIFFRKNSTLANKTNLDCFIENKMSEDFISIYKLEIEKINKKQKKIYIEKCIERIHKQNLEQGKNGVYSIGNSNEYSTIRNIIKYDNIILETKEIHKLMNVLVETICCDRQTINAKNNAIQLIIYLKKRFYEKRIWRKYGEIITNNKDNIICGKNVMFLDNESILSIKINMQLLYAIFNLTKEINEIDLIITAVQLRDIDKIRILENIYYFLEEIDYDKVENKLIEILLQYASIMVNETERDVRFWAAKCLIQLSYSTYKDIALQQLSNIMNSGNGELKIALISRIKEISLDDKNNEFVKFIINKGKVDNNFLVRRIALDYIKGENNSEDKK